MTRERDTNPNAFVPGDASDKDLPLREDIRLLGRLLGDCVREQEGEDTFDIIENIRQTSIRFYRDDDAAAKRELENYLDALDSDQAVQVVRAFSYFSHLANIAEDQHHIRRIRATISPATPHGRERLPTRLPMRAGREFPVRRSGLSSATPW